MGVIICFCLLLILEGTTVHILKLINTIKPALQDNLSYIYKIKSEVTNENFFKSTPLDHPR